MRTHILALNGVFDTGLAAVLDAFATANALAEMTGLSSLRFQTKAVGLRKDRHTMFGSGMSWREITLEFLEAHDLYLKHHQGRFEQECVRRPARALNRHSTTRPDGLLRGTHKN